MLRQSPLGRYTAFQYDNAVLFGHVKYIQELIKKDERKADEYLLSLRDGSDKDKKMYQELHLCSASRMNKTINGMFMSMIDHYNHGIKGISPTPQLVNALALTDANYTTDDFMMPYPEMIIDIPDECAGHLSGSFKNEPRNRKLMEEFGLDPDCITKGFKIACVFIHVREHEPHEYKQFGGFATRTMDITIITEAMISGPMVRPSTIRNVFGYPINYNPSPICAFSRPLIPGMEMEKLIRYTTGEINDSPGSYAVGKGTDDHGTGIVTDWHLAAETELEYIIRLTRMALNCIHAVTQIGYEKITDSVPQKLIQRGGEAAKRVIPDILKPVSLLVDEAKKAQYSDDSIGHSGIVMAPHFRRGHWRKQHYGQQMQQTKTIWIAPTVINKHLLREAADKNVIKNAMVNS